MKKQTVILAPIILLSAVLIGNMVIAPFIFTVLIPTIGRTTNIEVSVTWQNGTEVTQIDWGIVENNTETSLHDLLNITNTGNRDATLLLSAVNQVNITSLTLSWNATSPLAPNDSILVQLNQTVNANEETFSYDTKIDATG